MVETLKAPDEAVAKHLKKDQRVEFLADKDFVERATEAAEQLGLSLGAFVRVAVIEKIERDTRRRESTPKSDDD